MADPRTDKYGPQTRSANHSELMKALTRVSLGEKVNFCPHGCKDADLDQHGYCRHLVGFTLPGDDTRYEVFNPPDRRGTRWVQGARVEKVQKGDRLERITVSSRVYREHPELEAATRPEETK